MHFQPDLSYYKNPTCVQAISCFRPIAQRNGKPIKLSFRGENWEIILPFLRRRKLRIWLNINLLYFHQPLVPIANVLISYTINHKTFDNNHWAAAMAPLCLNSSFLPSSLHYLHSRSFHCPQSSSGFCFQTRTRSRSKAIRLSIAKAEADVRKEDIVIVGAGIAGLATAVSLHRSDT